MNEARVLSYFGYLFKLGQIICIKDHYLKYGKSLFADVSVAPVRSVKRYYLASLFNSTETYKS